MAFTTTYYKLYAELQDWLEDDDLEFEGEIPNVIALGELRLLRDLDLTIFDIVDTSISFAVGTRLYTKPTIALGFIAPRAIWYEDVNNETVWLERRTPDWLQDYWPTAASNGTPQYYAEYSETQWAFAPTPDAIRTLNLRLISRPAGLSDATLTTWLSDNIADALFKACLAEAEKFVMAEERAAVWEQDYIRYIPTAMREAHRLGGFSYPELKPAARVASGG